MNDLFAQLADIFRELPGLWIATIFILSLLVGSFLNVVIHRVPIMLDREWRSEAEEILDVQEAIRSNPETKQPAPPYNLVVPRSACPKCSAPIEAHQNIPVISWLVLRGKCANCAAPISIRYPLVELLTAVLSAAVAWKFGVHWYTAAALFLTWMLVALAGIDFDTTLLPDNMTLPLLWIGLLLSIIGPDPNLGLPTDMQSSILGAVAGYLCLWSVYHLFKLVTDKEGMGYGDFKLLAALGAWLGWQSLPLIIVLSAFAGSIIGISLVVVRGRDRDIPIPFGPFLAIAGWIALMWGDQLIGAYKRVSGMS